MNFKPEDTLFEYFQDSCVKEILEDATEKTMCWFDVKNLLRKAYLKGILDNKGMKNDI